MAYRPKAPLSPWFLLVPIFATAVLIGCGTQSRDFRLYKLQTGEVVKCKFAVQNYGMIDLYCTGGRTIHNVTNFERKDGLEENDDSK